MLSHLIKEKFLQKIACTYNKRHFVVCMCVRISKVSVHLTVRCNSVEEQAEWEEGRWSWKEETWGITETLQASGPLWVP